jgi:hypothetical protein
MPVVYQDVAVADRVEVSGWDCTQESFVEKTELQLREESGKQVQLSHTVTAIALASVRSDQSGPRILCRIRPTPWPARRKTASTWSG